MEIEPRPIEEIIAENIKLYFRKNGITLIEVAKKLGISGAAMSYHLQGKRLINKDIATELSRLFGFNINYLRYGHGALTGSLGSPAIDDSYIFEKELAKLEKMAVDMQTNIDGISNYLIEIKKQRDLLIAQIRYTKDSIEG